jgi:hypothetical protein
MKTECKERRTRFEGLNYFSHGPGYWQFVDGVTHAPIGPVYPTKGELLADAHRFYTSRWGSWSL